MPTHKSGLANTYTCVYIYIYIHIYVYMSYIYIYIDKLMCANIYDGCSVFLTGKGQYASASDFAGAKIPEAKEPAGRARWDLANSRPESDCPGGNASIRNNQTVYVCACFFVSVPDVSMPELAFSSVCLCNLCFSMSRL